MIHHRPCPFRSMFMLPLSILHIYHSHTLPLPLIFVLYLRLPWTFLKVITALLCRNVLPPPQMKPRLSLLTHIRSSSLVTPIRHLGNCTPTSKMYFTNQLVITTIIVDKLPTKHTSMKYMGVMSLYK